MNVDPLSQPQLEDRIKAMAKTMLGGKKIPPEELASIVDELATASPQTQNALSQDSAVLLSYAIYYNKVDTGLKLIESGASMQYSFGDEDNLCLAARLGRTQLGSAMVKKGAPLDRLNAISNDIKKIKSLYVPPYGFLENTADFMRMFKTPDSPMTLLDAYCLSKGIGHSMGLRAAVTFGADGEEFKFKTEGSMSETSLRRLKGLLTEYSKSDSLQDKPEGALFKKMDEVVSRSLSLMESNSHYYAKSAHNDLCEDYKRGEPIYVSSGFATGSHCIAIAIHGNHLVYTNRGTGGVLGDWDNQDHGTKIFKIPDGFEVTPRFILDLMMARNQDYHQLHHTLRDIMKEENLVASLPTKPQERDNCTFCNPKSCLEGLMLLLKNGNNDDENLKRLVQEHLDENRSAYKDFTRFIRNSEIELVGKVADLAKSDEMKDFVVKLVSGIIAEHKGMGTRRDEKEKEETDRLAQLIEMLPDDMQKNVRADLPKSVLDLLKPDEGIALESISSEMKDAFKALKEAVNEAQQKEDLQLPSISELIEIDLENKTNLTNSDLSNMKFVFENVTNLANQMAKWGEEDAGVVKNLADSFGAILSDIASRAAKENAARKDKSKAAEPKEDSLSDQPKVEPLRKTMLFGFKTAHSRFDVSKPAAEPAPAPAPTSTSSVPESEVSTENKVKNLRK